MAWYLGSVRIYVQDAPRSMNQIIARLQPIQGASINHVFGYEKEKISIKCKAVGEADAIALSEMAADGNTHYLDGGVVFSGWDVLVNSITVIPTITVSQTLTADCDATVYDVSMELLTD
jgi:hypothetical protein